MPGRTPLLAVPAIRFATLSALASNMPIRAAAPLVGVSEVTIRDWVFRGKRAQAKYESGGRLNPNEQMYMSFTVDAEKAQAQCIKDNLELITKHGKKKWQAAAWLLERRYPDMFGRRESLDVNAQIAVAPVDLSTLSIEDLATMRRILKKAEGPKALENNGAGGNGAPTGDGS